LITFIYVYFNETGANIVLRFKIITKKMVTTNKLIKNNSWLEKDYKCDDLLTRHIIKGNRRKKKSKRNYNHDLREIDTVATILSFVTVQIHKLTP
jgi:hypothetical protein